MEIPVKVLDEKFIPKRAHRTDAGYDVFAVEDVVIQPGKFASIRTDTAISMANCTCMMATVRGRSGLASKGIMAHVGTIDSGYQGEIRIILFNLSEEPFKVTYGDRVGQLVFSTILTPDFKRVEEFQDTSDRGLKGFGSTGI